MRRVRGRLRAARSVLLVVALGAVAGAGVGACDERRPRVAQPLEQRAGAGVQHRHPAELFADIDTTLAVAIEQGQLAALQATDVALRAFAVQQVARYTELREELRALAHSLELAPGPDVAMAAAGAVRHGERLRTLRLARGAQFDRVYVRQALAVHRDLLADLDAALRLVRDAEVRQALEQLRGAVGASMPDEARGR